MASLYNVMAVVFFLCCLTTTIAQENSTSQPGHNRTFMGCNINTKATNLSTCELSDSKFELNKVLGKHDNTATTNIVKITVSLANKTRYSEEMKLYWASEVGRTILTLVERAKDIRLFRSPLFTSPLEVGSEKTDIQLQEKTDGCVQPKRRKAGEIFDFVLRQLSHNDDKHFFKLCKAHKDDTTQYTTFNCCRIVGDRNLAICADYSSIVVDWALPIIIVIFCMSTLMIVPFVLEYVMNCPETKFYKTSDNPLSLFSIASVLLFEEGGPYKSVVRRVLFVAISYSLAFLPDFFGFECLQSTFIGWGIAFVFLYKIQLKDNEDNDIILGEDAAETCNRPELISQFAFRALSLKEKMEKTVSIIHEKCRADCNILFSCSCESLKGLLICFIIILWIIYNVLVLLVCLPIFIVCDLLVSFAWPNRGNYRKLKGKWCQIFSLPFVIVGLRLPASFSAFSLV